MAVLPSLDTTQPVLIFKTSRSPTHHGALAIARSLGRLGIPVYAIVEDAYTPLARSRYLTKAFVVKQWARDSEAFLSAMSTIASAINRQTIVIPLDDLSAVFVAENANTLSQSFLFPKLPQNLPRQLANKASFYSLCAEIGIPCAQSVAPLCLDNVREFIERAAFPVVMKAAEQWHLLNNKFNVKVIHSREAALALCDQIEFQGNPQVVLQEYIPGSDWIYHGYCNSNSGLYVSFTGKKLLDYPPGTGATAVGLSFRNDKIRALSEELLRAVSYSGISDIDWRQDDRDGQFKILDCNPRIGMNFRMFEDGAGIDVVRAEHLDLTGRKFEDHQMVEGRSLIVEPYYVLSYVRGGRTTANAEVDKAGSRELAWWSSDDKIPFLLMSVRVLLDSTRRSIGYIWNYLYSAGRRLSGQTA